MLPRSKSKSNISASLWFFCGKTGQVEIMLEIFHSQIAMCKDNFWMCIFEKLFVWLDFARCLSPPCLSHFYLCNDYNRSSITACSSVLSYTYISMCKLLSTWTSAGVSWWTFVSTHVCKHSLFLYLLWNSRTFMSSIHPWVFCLKF